MKGDLSMKKKNNWNQLVAFCMAFVFILSIMNTVTAKDVVLASSSFEQLQKQYPSGSTWNGSYKGKAWQCHGWACLMADLLTGSDPYSWRRVYNLSSLKAGDIIRCNRPHSILVTAVNGDTITYADCNWVGPNKVSWGQTIKRSSITSKFGRLSYVMSAPTTISQSGSSAALSGKPEIINVGIDSISADHVRFHFTAKNAALAKVCIESRNTGKGISKSYTTGLNKITYTFNTSQLPGTTELNIRIYAYSTINGGNEILHQLLYGSIPNVVQLPQKNPSISEIDSLIFDYRFYADMYPDLKLAYGYDQKKLYEHWKRWGIGEGRASSAVWNPVIYLNENPDIKAAVGNDYRKAYEHFITFGYKEYRCSSQYYNGQYYKNKYLSEFGNFSSKDLLTHFKCFGLREQRWANTKRYSGSSSWR